MHDGSIDSVATIMNFGKFSQLCHLVCDKHVEQFSRYDIHEASCSHGTLVFNVISMVINCHELSITVTNQHNCLQIGLYRDLTS